MILLRHGQSEFNLHFTATRRDPGIPDPKLTPLGHEQADAAARAIIARPPGTPPITRIIVSPYTRAIQTAQPLARALGLPLTVNPLVRERYAFTCDVGSPRAHLAAAFPQHDFSGLDEVWWPQIEEPAPDIIARAALFRAEMTALPDWPSTVLVTHWGFIMSLTGQSVQNGDTLEFDPTAPPPDTIPWRH